MPGNSTVFRVARTRLVLVGSVGPGIARVTARKLMTAIPIAATLHDVQPISGVVVTRSWPSTGRGCPSSGKTTA